MQLVVRAAAAYVGFLIGGPTGAQIGWAVGGFLAPPTKVSGPKIEDLSAPRLQYGAPWPRLYGRERVSASPIWVSQLYPHESTQSAKGGGSEVTTTTYTVDILCGCAIDSGVVGIARVWYNKKLVYNVGPGATPADISNSASTNVWTGIRLFDGNAAQLPWENYETAVGIGNAPAYRHRTTIAISGLDCGNTGQPGLLEFELFTVGSAAASAYVDNFVDGLGPYSGDLASFGTDVLDYGPLIYGVARAPSPDAKAITRSIPTVTARQISVRFRWSQTGDDDTTALILTLAGVTKIIINPMRDSGVDVFKRPNVTIGVVEHPIFTNELVQFAWYKVIVYLAASGSHVELYTATSIGDALQTDTLYAGDFSNVQIDGIKFYIDNGTGSNGSSAFSQLSIIGDGATIGVADLADIVTAECERVGLDASQIDVADLVGVDVTGYGTSQGARPTLEQLASTYYFEAFTTDKVVFRRRGGAVAETIQYVDTGAGSNGPGEPFNGMERADDLAVPAFYSVSFQDLTRDYEIGSVMSDRLVTESTEVQSLQLPAVMTPTEAKGRANTFSLDGRVAAHNALVPLNIEHLERTPTDVVTMVDIDGTSYRTRIVRQTFADMVLACELVLDDATVLVESGIAPPDSDPAVTVTAPGATFLELIDSPIMRNDDDDAGLYGATRISGGSGTTSRVFKSVDGVTYSTLVDINEQDIGGFSVDALADVSDPWSWDELNTVEVNASDALASSTKAAMQADLTINVIALKAGTEWEILRFRTATLTSDSTYILSGLIRGLRGTEHVTGDHAVGDHFILMRTQGIRRLTGQAFEIGLTRYYKGVTLGQSVDSVGALTFVNQAIGLRPFSPVRLRAERDDSGNITFTWSRRTRLSVRYGGSGGTVAPVGEDSESYQLDVYDSGSVIRTITATSETAAYSAADQTTDFGGTLGHGDCDAEVFQISATVGRGIGLRKSV